jgi:membrane protease YdiL (CAAX protease family)
MQAPAWHTLILIAVLVASGLAPLGKEPARPESAALALIGIETILLAYVVGGLVAFSSDWRQALSQLFGRLNAWGQELFLGVLSASALLAISLWSDSWVARHSSINFAALLPATAAERALWITAAAIIACSEEVVFRGYLQQQFEALHRRFIPAALLQSAVFALAHANQGLAAAIRIACFGFLLGMLAKARRGLLAAITAHFLLDACVAFWR